MISIIICSRTSTIDSVLSENIKNTIGSNYELIIIDNAANQYSIFEAYNVGIAKSTNNLLCFLHDDIFIHTNNWGTILIDLFEKNKEIGLIGIAGAKVKTKMPSGWWDCPHDQKAAHLIQHFNNEKKVTWNYGFEQENNVEVAVIDGVFMAMRKNENIQFDSDMKGFHNYDLSISLNFKKNGHKIIVTNQILIEHFSLGNLDKNWLKAIVKFHKTYRKYLPVSIEMTSDSKEMKALELKNAKKYIRQILNLGFNKTTISLLTDFFIISLKSGIYKEYLKKTSK
ncbi:glycosyltransferase family protein [Flavobacterium sp. N1736]|uniref:glycosyltransferase family protein n=1 Tax=Flavobacterium sp. N1736 TaxID=2986823 RepID=UPI00222446E0|nr:glycosyltransferase family protein [Flavobacterium sp. N1736]